MRPGQPLALMRELMLMLHTGGKVTTEGPMGVQTTTHSGSEVRRNQHHVNGTAFAVRGKASFKGNVL
eukprot:2982401-Amphidinium_carterae.2